MEKIEKDIQASLLKVTGINYNVTIVDETKKNKGDKTMKRNRSNSKEVKEAIKLHLIEIAQNDDVEIKTVEEAKNYIIKRFNLEVLRFKRKNEPLQKLFTDWLNGLALHTYFYTSDIIDYLHSIGLYGKNEQQEQTKAADLYYYLIFKEVKDDIFKGL